MSSPGTPWDRVHTVLVLGLHKTGTHAALKFFAEHFSVKVEPKMRRGAEGDGVAYLPSGQKLWKHSFPACIKLHAEHGIGVVITSRHPVPWIASLVEESFNIRPASDNKTNGGFPVDLLLQATDVRICLQRVGQFPGMLQDHRSFSTVELWGDYMHGYFHLRQYLNDRGIPCTILRSEDLIMQPDVIFQVFRRLGLRASVSEVQTVIGATSRTRELDAEGLALRSQSKTGLLQSRGIF